MKHKDAQVSHLFVKTQRGGSMQPSKVIKLLPEGGIVGDVSFGRSKRQILLASLDVFTRFAISPGDLRENIIVDGMNIDGIFPGQLIRVGEVLLESVGECTPCERLNEIRSGLKEDIRGNRGLLASVVHGGFVRIADPVSLLK